MAVDLLDHAFWVSALILVYTFAGYPLVMFLASAMFPRPVGKARITPMVSLIIAAHNEEKGIREKIENSLALDYPPERRQIIVASDCSTDRTDQIVREYSGRGVELVRLPERLGKVPAQNLAVTKAQGDILFFSDATILLPPDALAKMVRNFADLAVGCVSCEDKSISVKDGRRVEDEGLYVKYEMLLRRWESGVGSIVGASGCFFGIRKELWTQPDDFLAEDFAMPLNIREQGFRTVSEPEAIAYVKAVPSAGAEFARRVRTATHGLMGLFFKRHLLNPFRFGFFSVQLFSHKVLRFTVPVFMSIILVANLFLVARGNLYLGIFALQICFYLGAGAGYLLRSSRYRPRIASFPFYFVMVNVAIALAWVRVLQGRRHASWMPSQRISAADSHV